MSIAWTLIATFLYIEIVVVLLLVLPIASPSRWNRIFNSRFLAILSKQSQIFFLVLMGMMLVFLLDAIREIYKYTNHEDGPEMHSTQLFRAQRNFYISGFSIFLVLIIRCLVTSFSTQANLLAQCEALLIEKRKTEKSNESIQTSTLGESNDLQEYVEELTSALKRVEKDKESLRSQLKILSKEYDRIAKKFNKMFNKQKKLSVSDSTISESD
ncbi:B-cell receptor-associated protein 31-like [Teleopsis dalmanni]|uniref:B-cell receptor-associated protein 31-like n=1 Tax=Teleopsis dalmanni TaxID=139649 RepID=UPI0018CF357F|nr:B-cell receptor-associated protein 31-like [Teleopsis dalmanni]